MTGPTPGDGDKVEDAIAVFGMGRYGGVPARTLRASGGILVAEVRKLREQRDRAVEDAATVAGVSRATLDRLRAERDTLRAELASRPVPRVDAAAEWSLKEITEEEANRGAYGDDFEGVCFGLTPEGWHHVVFWDEDGEEWWVRPAHEDEAPGPDGRFRPVMTHVDDLDFPLRYLYRPWCPPSPGDQS